MPLGIHRSASPALKPGRSPDHSGLLRVHSARLPCFRADSDIRPREVIDVEDDKNQVLSNSNVQASGSQDQSQASASVDKVQDQQQVASSSSQSNACAPTNQCHKRLSFGLYNW